MQAAYTVSKLIDNVTERFSGRSNFIDPNNLDLSRSVSDEDRSQVFQANRNAVSASSPGWPLRLPWVKSIR
ncbi:MAG: hypothetical protein DMF74_07405 [Acidobacteria bacterium]|nr:MAG: hypothetical protein DMF74_07405 [Acidobacteriota bacterium]